MRSAGFKLGEEVTFIVASSSGRAVYSFDEDGEDRATDLVRDQPGRRLIKVTTLAEEVQV